MRELAIQMLLPILGYVLAVLIRLAKRTRFWGAVRAVAIEIVKDEQDPITDPKEAAEKALLVVQKPQLEVIARSVRDSVQPLPPERPTPRRGIRPPSNTGVDRPWDRK